MKIKGFIAVKGKTNTGKSHIIIRCFLRTLEKKAILIKHKFVDYPEFVALVEWQGKYLGFISRGDDVRTCKKDYQQLENMAKEHTSVLDSCVFVITEKQRIKTTEGIEEFWKEKLKENDKEEYDEILELDNSPVDNINKNIEKIKSNIEIKVKNFWNYLEKI